MRNAPVFVFLLVIVGALVWWLAFRTDAAPPITDNQASVATNEPEQPAPATIVDQTPEPEGDPAEDASLQRVQAPADDNARLPAPGEAVIRGRCVDPNGNPLAGVTIDVHGWRANQQRVDAYLREHDEIVWEDPEEFVTEADGRFAMFFVPPPPYQFTLNLRHPEFAQVGGRWGKIPAGTDKDLGDVVLPRGAAVSGRVVDVDGVPQAGISVRLNRYNRKDRWRGEMHPRENANARTQPDGTFRISRLLAPATWNLNLRGAQLAKPQREAEIAIPATSLELIVKRAADVPSIRGIVVDDRGDPVRGAHIDPVGRSGGGMMTTSKRDGTFTLERREQGEPTGKFQLTASCRGYEALTTTDKYEWGASNVRIVMRAGIDVLVDVRRADDDTPVEEFALRAFPKPGTTGRWSSSDSRVRGGWQHEGGRATAKGLLRGPNLIIVEPRASSGLARSDPIEINVRDGASSTVTVHLATNKEQTVRVVYADGKPCQGSTVELLELVADVELTTSTPAKKPSSYGWMQSGSASLIDQATTDASGTCVIRGANDREFALRVTGEAHAPVLEPTVRLGDEVLECVIPTGATIRVTLRPLELLADLREQAMLPRKGPIGEDGNRKRPGIRLRRKVGDSYETAPAESKPHVPFDDQGVAILRGVMPGTWDLQMVSCVAFDESGWTTMPQDVRTDLLLREGETMRIELDMHEARRARLQGTVTVGGKPFVGSLQLNGEVGMQPNGEPKLGYANAKTDANGTFSTLVPAGTWRVGPYIRSGERGFTAWAPSSVRTVAGQDARADFAVRIAKVKLRLLAPDGKPVEGIQVMFQRDGKPMDADRPPTDTEGRTTITTTPGTATPQVMLKSLLEPEKQRAYWTENAGDPTAFQRMLISLPPIAITEFEQNEIEIRLPTEWDR